MPCHPCLRPPRRSGEDRGCGSPPDDVRPICMSAPSRLVSSETRAGGVTLPLSCLSPSHYRPLIRNFIVFSILLSLAIASFFSRLRFAFPEPVSILHISFIFKKINKCRGKDLEHTVPHIAPRMPPVAPDTWPAHCRPPSRCGRPPAGCLWSRIAS